MRAARLLSLLLVVGLALSGCAGAERTAEPPVTPPPAFSDGGAAPVPDRWWRAFDDARLNAVVDTALAANLDVRAAWERLRAAEAVVDRAAADGLPQIDGTARTAAGRAPDRSDGVDALELGLSSSYEVDLWGRIAAGVDAERYRAAATYADFQTAAVTLSAEIVRAWYALAEADAQVALADAQIATNLDVLVLLRTRFEAGQIRGVDVLRQRQLVEAAREQRAEAVARRETLEHRLAVLLGRPPVDVQGPAPEALPDLPPLPRTGVPVELVRRRPDVRSAFLLLRAADRDLASAISARYPRLTLTASAASFTGGAGGVFQDWALSVAGDVLAPIFYGGRLRAEVDRVEAVTQQRLYEYGQTVLVAFQEVEDALARERQAAEGLVHLENQVVLAEQAYEQLRVQYLNGTIGYLDVLVALDDLQQLRRDLLAARLALVEFRVALYRALAGSFETPYDTGRRGGPYDAAPADAAPGSVDR